jgi:hypothetical protein
MSRLDLASSPVKKTSPLAVAGMCALGAACHDPTLAPPDPNLVIEDGSRQLLYEGSGRQLTRIVLDADGDGRAEAQTFFLDGHPVRTEADTDRDGMVDRWEEVDTAGRLVRLRLARRRPGIPDVEVTFDARGRVSSLHTDDPADCAGLGDQCVVRRSAPR